MTVEDPSWAGLFLPGEHLSGDESDDSFDDEEHADRGKAAHREYVGMSADPELGSVDRPRCPVWGSEKAGQRHLEQPEHHEVEADHEQHGDGGGVLELVNLIEAG